MFTMTKARALQIQSEQIEYYSKWVPDLADRVAKITKADELDDGKEYDVYIINQYIPRGGAIERIVEANSRARFSTGD